MTFEDVPETRDECSRTKMHIIEHLDDLSKHKGKWINLLFDKHGNSAPDHEIFFDSEEDALAEIQDWIDSPPGNEDAFDIWECVGGVTFVRPCDIEYKKPKDYVLSHALQIPVL